jgi:site-specific DNA-cytosine methylase
MFKDIPSSCILTNMEDTTIYSSNNNGHPYLLSKLNPTLEQRTYPKPNSKTKSIIYDSLFSFGKRNSPIHCEIIDIRNPSKTIICTYGHQPRMFVPLHNPCGYFLRSLLPDELKQIQGFPSTYTICGNTKEQIIQIGNAVPPPLVQSIVQTILQ